MSDEIVFYTNPMSRGRMVRWILEELAVPYRTEIIEFGLPMKRKSYTAINRMGKVPALTHRGVTITEVPAILAYLADAFPGKGLAPATDDPARGSYYRWLFFAAGPLEAAVVNKSLGFEVPKEQRGRVGYGSYDLTLDTLEREVSGRSFLAGGKFSAADIYVGSQLGWGMMSGGIDKRPAFEAYVAQFHPRPAFQRASEIDNALVAKPS